MSAEEKRQKEAEQQKFKEIYLPEEFYSDEEEEIEYCDYGLDDGEGCVNPQLKHTNNCWECWLMQEATENNEKGES